MFFHNPKSNFIFIYTPLAIPQIGENIKHYMIGSKDVDLNEYKGKKDILPYMAYSLNIKAELGAEEWDSNYTFGIIRNPFDYMIEMYEFYVNGPVDRIAWCKGIKETKDAIKEQHRIKSRGFAKWVLDDKDYDYLHSFPFCGPRLTSQLVWLSEVNDIFCFENTTPLLNKLFKVTKTTLPSFAGVPTKRELKNKRADYYDRNPKVVDLITDSFREEIKMFNFTVG